MNTIYFVLACLLGMVVMWYIMHTKQKLEIKVLQNSLDVEQQQLKKSQITLEEYHRHILELTSKVAGLESYNKYLLEKIAEQKKEMIQVQEKLLLQFKNLSNDLLEEKSKKFTDQNFINLERILVPLRERIQTFETQVAQTHQEGLDRNVALRTEIRQLHELNLKITKEAESLTKAIKGDTKMQGGWGEFILENILEKSGLVKDKEYIVQASFITEGKRFQPDVIIKLPGEKNLIIDAKVSLTNYELFFNTESEEERSNQLKQHIQSVKKHIKTLSEKNYQITYDLNGLDFVLMFIPIEPAFNLAIQYDVTLLNEAYDKNIIIVSPTNLIATLRTIANLWKFEHQNQYAIEIANQGGALYDKFVSFVEDLKSIGHQITVTHKVYGEAMKKLYDGKGNLINRAHTIKQLGARTSKELDQKLVSKAQDSL